MQALINGWTGWRVRSLRDIRPLVFLAALSAVFPVFVLAAFLGFVLEVSWGLGRLPHFGDPDPNAVTAGLQRTEIALGLVGWPVASIGAVGLAVLGRWRNRDFPLWRLFVLTGFSAGLLLAFMARDPGGFLNWFWD